MSRRAPLAALLVVGLVLPFVNKPVHIDDANFLVLAHGAAADPWRPHAIDINWQGTTERAFDVLSNPPGIGWWLAPVAEAGVVVQHLWMLPWLLLALWGAYRLGVELVGTGRVTMLVLGTSPLVLLAAQALTPDLPLFACTVAGVAGFLGRRHLWAFALLAGCAALFRYSGLCLVPLLVLAGFLRGGVRGAALGALSIVPFLALTAHDVLAYGESHFVAMTGFQGVANTPREVFRKLAASIAMLGGAGLFPLVRSRWSAVAGALGAAVGIGAVVISEISGLPALLTIGFAALGAADLAKVRFRRGDDLVVAAWVLGGLAFLLTLRFTAARYWLPFLPGVAVAGLRLRPPRRVIGAVIGAQVLLGLLLSMDDRAFAKAQHEAARAVVAEFPEGGQFAGHWGWQHALEAAGWEALEEDAAPTGLLAVAATPWPQTADPESCLEEVWRYEVPDRRAGPRVHTADGRANLHAFLVAGDPPVETYAPWSVSEEPFEQVVVYQPCR